MYKVLSQIRANGKNYLVGDSFPENLKKVDYEQLVSNSYLEKLSKPQPQPKSSETNTPTKTTTTTTKLKNTEK